MLKVLNYIFLSLLLLQMNIGHARSSVTVAIPYKYFVKNAEKIFEGKISNVKQVNFTDGQVCGWEVEFDVTKSWKGGYEKVILFTTTKYFNTEPNSSHLVILTRNTEFDITILNDEGLMCDRSTRLEPQLNRYKYRLTRPERLIFPFDKHAERNFEGRWLTFSSKDAGASEWAPKTAKWVKFPNDTFKNGYEVISYQEFVETFLESRLFETQ